MSAIFLPSILRADESFVFVTYGQASFAEQSLFGQRIDRINATQGTDFSQGSEPTSAFLGARLLKEVSPLWSIGMQAEYGRVSISRRAVTVGPAVERLVIAGQETDVLAHLMVAGRRSLCGECARFEPFFLTSAGAGYASGSTFYEANPTSPHGLYNYLRLESEGWFPVATVALGVGIPLDRLWSLELGAGYMWGRLRKDAPAEGPQRFPGEPVGEPGEQVATELSVTGPSVWVGLGRRF